MLRKEMPPKDFFEKLKREIRNANVEEVKALIQFSNVMCYDLNSHDIKTKYTLLHFAICRSTDENVDKMLDILQLLKNAGCSIDQNALDSFHVTPVHTACRRARPELLNWLIKNGARIEPKDASGQTPLDYVEKQLQCEKDHMSSITKDRLEKVKNILCCAEKKRISNKHAERKLNVYQLGFFAMATTGFAAVAVMQSQLFND